MARPSRQGGKSRKSKKAADMAQPDSIIAHVPYLRRHARLLTGSQELGDEFVRLCLELVVAEPQWLEGDNLRVQLFRAFHAAWSRVHETIADESTMGEVELVERVRQGLAGLPSAERRTLALIVVEEFTYEDTAYILGMTVDQVRRSVANARNELLSRVSVSVLIIEDEQIVASDIARIVEDMGHRVAGMAAHQAQSVSLAEELKPGLVLADIRLEDDGDGIAAAQRILEAYEVPIVFVTGYPERLLTGGGLEPAFVVAKPFDSEALKVTIAHALATYASPDAPRHRAELLGKLTQITGSKLARSG
jgi:DNA-directed RNA polymerase specialized sigma24 family protein/CheY-like chemotaxis protein